MKRVMWFDLYGNKVAVYHHEDDDLANDYFEIYLLVGKKKQFIDYAYSCTEAAGTAMNYCYEHA